MFVFVLNCVIIPFDDFVQNKGKYTLKSNKIYPLMRCFSWDLIFFYAFNVMFWMSEKGFSASQIMFLATAKAIAVILFQFPANKIAKKIGYITALRIGAVCSMIFSISILFVDNFVLLIFFQVIFAIGFAFSEPAVASLAMKNLRLEGKSNHFAKLEGQGISLYYLINAVGIVLIGYLYKVSPYAAMSITFLTTIIFVVLSFIFRDESKYVKDNVFEHRIENNSNSASLKPLNISSKSKIVFFLIVAVALSFYGILGIESNMKKLLFQEFMFTSVVVGWINFAMQLVRSLASASYRYISKFSTLNIILMPVFYTTLYLIFGLLLTYIKNNLVCIILIVIFVILTAIFIDPLKIALKDVVSKTLPEKFQHTAISIIVVCRQISHFFYSFLIGMLLTDISISTGYIIIACFSYSFLVTTFTFFGLLYLHKKRNPDQGFQVIMKVLNNKNFEKKI